MSPKTPVAPPFPTLGLAEIHEQLGTLLGELQLHAAHAEDTAAMRKLINAGTYLAMASSTVGQVAKAVGSDVTTLQALHGLSLLTSTPEKL